MKIDQFLYFYIIIGSVTLVSKLYVRQSQSEADLLINDRSITIEQSLWLSIHSILKNWLYLQLMFIFFLSIASIVINDCAFHVSKEISEWILYRNDQISLMIGFYKHWLILTIQDLAKNTDLGEQTALILLNFSKAFDKFPHERLLYKAEYYMISAGQPIDQGLSKLQKSESRCGW